MRLNDYGFKIRNGPGMPFPSTFYFYKPIKLNDLFNTNFNSNNVFYFYKHNHLKFAFFILERDTICNQDQKFKIRNVLDVREDVVSAGKAILSRHGVKF